MVQDQSPMTQSRRNRGPRRARSRSLMPVRKVWAIVLAAPVAHVLPWVFKELVGRDMPGDIATSLTTIVLVLAGYMTPPGVDEVVELQ